MSDPERATSRPLWASVADGFYVGSQDGTFLGYVDRQHDGAWRAFDAASRAVGDFSDHHRAMAAVTQIGAVSVSAGELETPGASR